jgi:hypothetical protein
MYPDVHSAEEFSFEVDAAEATSASVGVTCLPTVSRTVPSSGRRRNRNIFPTRLLLSRRSLRLRQSQSNLS